MLLHRIVKSASVETKASGWIRGGSLHCRKGVAGEEQGENCRKQERQQDQQQPRPNAAPFAVIGTDALAGGLDADDVRSSVARVAAPVPRPSPLPAPAAPTARVLVDAVADPVPGHALRSLREPDANRFRAFAPIRGEIPNSHAHPVCHREERSDAAISLLQETYCRHEIAALRSK